MTMVESALHISNMSFQCCGRIFSAFGSSIRHHRFAASTRSREMMSDGNVESQYLVGSFSLSGHSISRHSLGGFAHGLNPRVRTRVSSQNSFV
jgi:hypothetical protein